MKSSSRMNKRLIMSGIILGSLYIASFNYNNVFASTPAFLNTKTEIYKTNSTSGGTYGEFPAGTEVNFESMDSVWLKLTRTAGGKTHTGYTNIPKNVTLKDTIETYQNNNNGQSLWSDAGLSNKIVDTIPYNTKLTVAKFSNGKDNNSVAYVRLPDGRIGFLNATYLSTTLDSGGEG